MSTRTLHGNADGDARHARSILRLRVSVAILAVFAAVLLLAVGQASAAMVYQNDENGANDEPGQKDLTRHGVDASGLPGSIDITWNWDTTGFTGSNTGDGCALFDTDADGKVNYSICVVINDTPATWDDTRLYSCGDNKVDRCSSAVAQILTFTSSCTAYVTATDPFPSGESYPDDTSAFCTIQMADVGGGSASLVNTCSYPSQQPNSDPSDCVLVPRDGFLIIDKVAVPDNSNAAFDFTLDGGVSPVFTANGSETSGIIPVRSDQDHSLAESMPTLWSLDSAECDNDTGSLQDDTLSAIEVGSGDVVTCTFTNSFTKAEPEISTAATASTTVGGDIKDTATLSGGYNPEGTITFSLYSDDKCTTLVDSWNVDVDSGNGDYSTPTHTTTAAGHYYWIASYSGDDNNDSATGACGDKGEDSVVDQAEPEISTSASSAIDLGGKIFDTATLSGGYRAGGTITFRLYGPNDEFCETSVFTDTVDVEGFGQYPSAAFTPDQPGVYRWVASYSGDGNNQSTSGKCGEEGESVVVSKPAIDLQKSVSASPVDAGTTVVFTITATNTGDIGLTGVVVADDTCSPLVYQSGNSGDTDVMEPGESWVFTCSKAVSTSTVNVATVTAYSLNETKVSDTATAKVEVNAPVVQEVVPTVTLASLTKCVSRKFKLRPKITGGTPVNSVLTIDGRRRASSSSASPVFTVDTAKYTAGKRHRVVITTTFSNGAKVITRGSFVRCKIRTARKKVTPIFTGRAD